MLNWGETAMSLTTPLPTAKINWALNIDMSREINGMGRPMCRKNATTILWWTESSAFEKSTLTTNPCCMASHAPRTSHT